MVVNSLICRWQYLFHILFTYMAYFMLILIFTTAQAGGWSGQMLVVKTLRMACKLKVSQEDLAGWLVAFNAVVVVADNHPARSAVGVNFDRPAFCPTQPEPQTDPIHPLRTVMTRAP
jgi:hypothetical protein